MRRLDPWLLLAVVAIATCAYLAQGSTAKALATPGFANRQIVWLAVGAVDRKSTRLNSSHPSLSRMPSSA